MKFEYQGLTFTLRARTAFEEDMVYALYRDWATMLLKHLGMDDLQDLPSSWTAIMYQMVTWWQITTIEGELEGLPVLDLWLPNYNHLVQWRNGMNAHPELYKLWRDAFEGVNKEESDPLSEAAGKNGAATSDKPSEIEPEAKTNTSPAKTRKEKTTSPTG